VGEIVVAAYADLAKQRPSTRFVYGEAAWPSGGSFRPHRTHQNGTSVDFMVPVRDAAGRSVPLPGSPLDKFGYGIEFDAQGRYEDLTIDFEALSAHLGALERHARQRSVRLRRVILAPEYERRLVLDTQIPFMKGKPWIRHDEHYHVDFELACKPL
jgi:penicillin-insensitive murein endopeptidase